MSTPTRDTARELRNQPAVAFDRETLAESAVALGHIRPAHGPINGFGTTHARVCVANDHQPAANEQDRACGDGAHPTEFPLTTRERPWVGHTPEPFNPTRPARPAAPMSPPARLFLWRVGGADGEG